MTITLIERADDPRIEDYRTVREADLLGRRGVFLAEGEVVLRVLLSRGRFRVRSLLLSEARATALAPLLASVGKDVPVYAASQEVMNGIVGFPIHRGVLAAGEIGETLQAESLLAGLGPGPRRVVVLEGVVNHDNVGGIFRNCAAFGVDAVLLDEVSCDPLYRKAIRVSVGGSLFVPFARYDRAEAVFALLRRHGFAILALTPTPEATALGALETLPERAALLLGAEGSGLSGEALGGADHRVRIPMAAGFDSLNVATTSGIVLARVFEGHERARSGYLLGVKRCSALALLVGVFLLNLAACGGEDDPAPETAPTASTLDFPLEQKGPFRVGHRTITTSYQPPNGLPVRTITVHLWYPTKDTEGDPVKYLIFADKESFENASLAAPVESAGYPVHVHSHGMWGFAGNSAGVMRWFASHGWVAVAPDHTGNTLSDQSKGKIPLGIYYERPLDIRASLDAVEQLPSSDPLAGKLRTKQVSMSGHSFGTNTTWAVLGARYDTQAIQAYCDKGEKFIEPCLPGEVDTFKTDLSDPRVVAGIPMAGAPRDWFGAGFGETQKPVQQQSAVGDPVGADELWNNVSLPDFSWVEFASGCHQLFGLGGCEGYEDEEGFRLVSIYALAFARRHVLNDSRTATLDLLGGKTSISDKITYHRKEPTP